MANASKSSIYEEITLDKNGTRVALEGRTVDFKYYESIFSPQITASLTYIDTGDAIQAGTSVDTQERYGTIRNSLPITGKENLEFKIKGLLGTLDFTSNPLIVSEAPSLAQEFNREVVTLKLVSNYSTVNENKNVYKKYYNSISNTVNALLQNELGVPSNRINEVETTQNSYAFPGNGRRPFDVIISLCPKSIPTEGASGYMFWETRDGYNFKSIDSMISADSVQTYSYFNVSKAGFDSNDNNFRILERPTVIKNQNILDALRSGVYKTKNIFFNPYSLKYEEEYVSLSDIEIQNLGGQSYNVPSEFESGAGIFTRTNLSIKNPGNMEVGISTAVNNDPKNYQAISIMRYNILFSQLVDIIVPCNPNLRAGNVINCEFEKITVSNKNEGSIDQLTSGKYLIVQLCHSFDPKRSFTSLRLCRDTYGIYTNGG